MILPTHIVASGGIITNDRDEILLVKNPRKGWEYPGGIIEPGETLPQGLVREIKEETGVDVEIVNIVEIYSNTKKKKGYNGVEEVPTIVNIDFICKYISGVLSTSNESIEVKWLSKEVASKIVNQKQQLRFRRALDYQ
jgi:8-oxo-dGTP diphosphatase